MEIFDKSIFGSFLEYKYVGLLEGTFIGLLPGEGDFNLNNSEVKVRLKYVT